jgi:Protein of unknown function (DUF3379)
MMQHAQYRAAIITDPNDPNPELRAHRDTCAQCAAYTERLLRFESRLARALQIDLDAPPGTAIPAIPASAAIAEGSARRRATPLRRHMALAAGLVLGAVLAGSVWLAFPESSLAADVVAHVADEPLSWQRTDVAVQDPALQAVLHDSKLRLMPQAGTVSYASSCAFRGHLVPHLVVQSAAGPVTVMVLVHESARTSKQFDEQGYRGVIVPVKDHGSIAILMRDPDTDAGTVQRIAAQVRAAVVWTE